MQPVRVVHPSDPRIADFRDVKDADLRGRDGLFMVEGRLGVRRLLDGARFRARSVLVTPTALSALADSFAGIEEGVEIFVAEPPLLEEIVGYDLHRGCLAVAERRDGVRLDEVFARPPVAGPGLAVVAEKLTNPDNVGGVFRNAMAFGASGVWLCPRCADPLYRKAVRVSMGGALQIPFGRSSRDDWPADLEHIRSRGWRVVALDPRGDSMEVGELADRVDPAKPVALLLGTEGSGLDAASLAAADWRVRIEMAPGVDSLNVATAAAIALHQLARSRSASGQSALH